MTIRPAYFRQPTFDREDGTGGGAPASTSNDTQPGDQQVPPDERDVAQSFDDFWNDPDDEGDQQQQSRQPQQQQNSGAESDETQTRRIVDHINQRAPGVQVNQEMFQAMQDGDFEAFSQATQQAQARLYQNMLVDVNKIINQRISDGIEQAVQKATGTVNASSAIAKMNEQLPFTADKSVSVVANAALKQALKKNKGDVAAAIKDVDAYFDYMEEKKSGRKRSTNGRGFNRGGNPNSNGNSDDDGAESFMDILGPKA